MYIKRYSIASFLLMALIGSFVYMYITQENIALEVFSISIPSLPIAFLILLPLFVLYMASILHMLFYSFLSSLNLRKSEKDYEKIINAIVDTYLSKSGRKYNFKTPEYKLMGMLLENIKIFPTADLETTNNTKIDTVLKAIDGIKNGEIVDLKPYNLLSTNDLVIQNERNRYKKEELTAEVILLNASKYATVLREEVYVDFVRTASLQMIEKYNEVLTKESLNIILSRVNADENTLEISNDVLIVLLRKLDLTKADLIQLSSTISRGGMIPEQRMKLFELFSEENEDAMDAYLYTLFDLEMLSLADDILDISQTEEYPNFKAYRALKEANKNFNIELFI